MIKIALSNGKEYEVLANTVIHPGYGNTRSKFEIHMYQDYMSLDDFVALFTDENTKEIRLVEVLGDGQKTDVTYYDYVIVASVGLQRVTNVSVQTGEQTVSVELVAVLEQLTYIEKQLKALNVQF